MRRVNHGLAGFPRKAGIRPSVCTSFDAFLPWTHSALRVLRRTAHFSSIGPAEERRDEGTGVASARTKADGLMSPACEPQILFADCLRYEALGRLKFSRTSRLRRDVNDIAWLQGGILIHDGTRDIRPRTANESNLRFRIGDG